MAHAENKDMLKAAKEAVKKSRTKRALDRMKTSPPDKKSGSSTSDVFKSYGKYDGKPIELAGGGIAKTIGKKAVDWIKKNRKTIKKEIYSPEGKKKTQELTKKLQEGMKRPGHATGGRAGYRGGGRTNLLEELGRVEGEHSNRNRRAEVSRIHGELNKGYKSGGAVLKGKKVGCQIK